MPNAAAARVDDQVKHSKAREYRLLGEIGGLIVGGLVLGGLAALEIASFGAATPLVVVAGTVVVAAGSTAMLGGAVANVAADAGRKIPGPVEGPIVTGISSIKIGPEKHAAAHLGSWASCNRHKHGSTSTLEAAVDVAEDVAGGLIQDAVSLSFGGLFGGGRFNPIADWKQGIKDAHDEHDSLEQIIQGSKSVLIGSGSFHAARVGDQGTCGFSVGQGCESVIIGGETVTDGTIGDGDDPDKGVTDLISDLGGKAVLAGIFLITLPVGIIAAGMEALFNYELGEQQGAIINAVFTDPETRDKVNLALAALPMFHGSARAVRERMGSGGRPGGEEGGAFGESSAASQSGEGPANGGATRSVTGPADAAGPADASGEGTSSGQPTRAGRTENASPENASPAENPVHQIGEQPGGSDGSAPPDQAGGSGAADKTADTPGTAQPADPLVQQGDSPGGLRAADGSGARPDLSPEENFPGKQNGENCAPQSCQQIIRQATGVNHSEATMEEIAQRSGAYDPEDGTYAGGEADILNEAGVPAHTEDQTPENIQKALDNGQGVITGHTAGALWDGDPNYQADPAYPDNGGHAVHTTGLVRDADGNVTHYVINDTGTGTSGRMVPADQFHASLDSGPAVITDAPIRTPTTRPEPALPVDDVPPAGEMPGAPQDAASRGDPTSERGDPASGERAPENAKPGEDAKPAVEAKPADTPEAKAPEAKASEDTSAEDAQAAGDGDPTVQTGDRPGGLRSGEDEDGEGSSNADAPSRGARARRTIPDDTLDQWAKDYADKVNSDRRWTWADDMDSNIPEPMQGVIKQRAVDQGLIPNIPIDKSTTLPGRPGFADFTGSILKEVQMPETITNPDGSVTNLWLSKDPVQFRWLNDHLSSLDPNYSQDGGTWHHNQGGSVDEGDNGPGRPDGTMQLVRFGIHNITNHAGARSPGGWADAPR